MRRWKRHYARNSYRRTGSNYIRPSPGFAEQHDLLLARELAQPKDDMVPVRVINPSPAPVTLYQNTSVGTFNQLEDGALEPASFNRLATKKPRQTKPLVSERLDLDAMNLSSPERKELASPLDEFTDIFSSGLADLGRTGVVKHFIDTGDRRPKAGTKKSNNAPAGDGTPTRRRHVAALGSTTLHQSLGCTDCPGQEKRRFHTLLRGLSQAERRDYEGRLPPTGHRWDSRCVGWR